MQEQLTDVTTGTLEQISLSNPILALLLTLLIGAIIVTIFMIIRLNKKIEIKNDKLYEDAKADFKLVLAFEYKLDNCLAKDSDVIKDISELKMMMKDMRNLLFEQTIKN